MIRIAFCLFLILGGAAMAAPLEGPNYDPLKQVPTLDGKVRDPDQPPSDAEIAIWMWKRFAGDKPMPPNLRQKYGLPPEDVPPGQ
jgi:hypothetical protein